MRALFAVVMVFGFTGCVAMVPSGSKGTSELSSTAVGAMPKRIAIRAKRDQVDDAVSRLLGTELRALGFSVVKQEGGAEGIVVVEVRYSDFAPVHLGLVLTRAGTGEVLWRARVSREWDVYTSIIGASESNVRGAMKLLRRDLGLKDGVTGS